jgi:hypothetical protein
MPNKKSKKTTNPKGRALLLLVVGLLIICVVPLISVQHYGWFDYTSTGEIGDTIGGTTSPFLSLLGAILVYLSFQEQYNANVSQRTALNVEQFESKYFELIRLHRENLKTMEINGDLGIRFFQKLSKDLESSLDKSIAKNSGVFSHEELITICFYILYYGNEISTRAALRKRLFATGTNDRDSEFRTVYTEISSQVDNNGKFKFEGQYSVLLDNYFSMLSLLLKFSNRHTCQSNDEETELPNKEFYIDTIAAQFSVFEAKILFFYVVSGFGNKVQMPIDVINKFGLMNELYSIGINGVDVKELFNNVKI